MKDKLAPPSFNLLDQFDPDSFPSRYNDFVRRLMLFLNETLSEGEITVQLLNLTGAPTSATGQRADTVFVENGYLKLVGSSQASFRKAGTATIDNGNTTEAVAFSTAMSDTNYAISIATDGNELVWFSSKATTGFTLNRSASSGDRVVNWTVIPYSNL